MAFPAWRRARAPGPAATAPSTCSIFTRRCPSWPALPANDALDGRSLVSLLRNPDAPWQPTVSTYGRLNHAVRSDDFRYIRYEDGSEELYDHRVDPMEWTNLAADANYLEVKRKMKRWLPQVNVPGAPRQPAGKRTNKVAMPE